MSIRFNIDYKGWSDDASPINPNIKIKESHAKLIANTETSLRNKDPKFREKVSNGLKKYFGSLEERFFNCITKHKNGCWTCSKKTITYNKIDYQAKEISVMLHKIKQTNECITTNCGNNKCVNPKHLIFVSREDTAIKTLSKRKKISRDNGHQSKLSSLDVSNIKKMYNKLLQQRDGKHKGIASIIHKKYNNVSLSAICQIIKTK